MKFNFKSAGFKNDDKKFNSDLNSSSRKKNPIGIKTPVSLGQGKTKIFEMNNTVVEQIEDNLKNLVMTNQGERLGRFNFGCNLKSLLFERTSLDQEFDQIASEKILDQVKQYIPLINIESIDFKVNTKKPSNNMLSEIKIFISYSIPQVRINNKKIEIDLACGG